ncbi:hypothetical protein TNCT_313501 [Trichonephila clavata]|uniref:Uncharacterized protein n=1 Tax=Trichonephila clavata TaxID=2740835 RepID=A0A8X6JCG0_TRICU|nr:hypothetical protein TNCT_313501 [Trichonephila clavata]
MDPTLKYLFVVIIIILMTSISLAKEKSSKKDDIVPKYFRLPSGGKPLIALLKRTPRDISPLDRSRRFCEMFGCEVCNVPEEKKCCEGFSYDPRSKKCREVITS